MMTTRSQPTAIPSPDEGVAAHAAPLPRLDLLSASAWNTPNLSELVVAAPPATTPREALPRRTEPTPAPPVAMPVSPAMSMLSYTPAGSAHATLVPAPLHHRIRGAAPVPIGTSSHEPHVAAVQQATPQPKASVAARVSVALVAVCALLLAVGSHFAMSSALLACAALFLSDLAVASMAARLPHARAVSGALTIGAALIGVTALIGGVQQFSDMAFVAGLLVLLVTLPVLLLHVTAQLLARRRSNESIAVGTLQIVGIGRTLSMFALLISGYIAFDSFTAVPDALVSFAITALVAVNVVYAGRIWLRADHD